MILYEVYAGTIAVQSVLHETATGWREHNNGFINRREMGRWPCLTTSYCTTDLEEAKHWANRLRAKMHDTLQASQASLDDLETWQENGECEGSLPKSRIIY